jgi:hypothetical protein
MNITVTVIKAFSSGASDPVSLPSGSTCGNLASRVGAPSGCVFRVNGKAETADGRLGEGDVVIISLGKNDAG